MYKLRQVFAYRMLKEPVERVMVASGARVLSLFDEAVQWRMFGFG